MARAYQFLADKFEEFNDDCGYEQWSQYFIEGLKKLGVGAHGLELGCGSGYFCRRLKKEGFFMDGADLSTEMLQKAEYLAREEGCKINFFRADAANLVCPKKYDFILSPNDCFNYLPPPKLKNAFKKVSACIQKGGIFWFDISSSYKIKQKIANNIFADDREGATCLCFNTLYDDRVEMDVTLFIQTKNGLFERLDEKHTQYIHEEEDVVCALNEGGFELILMEGHLGEDRTASDRINFICRKK